MNKRDERLAELCWDAGEKIEAARRLAKTSEKIEEKERGATDENLKSFASYLRMMSLMIQARVEGFTKKKA